MSYTQGQPYDLGFLSDYVVGTGNTIRTGSGDASEFTPSDSVHYYSFSYAGGLSTVTITLNISAAQALASNVNFHQFYYGEINQVIALTALNSPTGVMNWAGNITGVNFDNHIEGTQVSATFQVLSANPGRAVFSVDGGGNQGDENGDSDIDMFYRVAVNVQSEAPLYAKAADTAATKDGQVQLSNLLTSSNNATYQQLQLWDSVGGSGGGFVVNGVQQAAGQQINITQAQLATTSFKVGAAGGTDNLWVRVQQNDGSTTSWQQFTVTSPVDRAPNASASNRTAAHLQSFAAASLFTATDPDGDAVTKYALWDTTGSGHFVVNGIVQAAGTEIDLSAAQLAQTTYQSGSGADALWVRANDGVVWGNWTAFSVTAPIDHAPVTPAHDIAAGHGQSFVQTSLFSVSDGDSDTITAYQLWDSTTDQVSGHWMVGGVVQGASQTINVTPAQLGSVTFQSGSGSDDLWVRANDGIMWGTWQEFHVNAPVDHLPIATVHDMTVAHAQNVAASSLFSVIDGDNDTIKAYQVWDSTSDATSGQWMIGGAAQAAGRTIDVTPAQLSSTTFQSGSGSDDLWVRASDGIAWGYWQEFHVNAPIDHAPVVSASDRQATHNLSLPANLLFSVSDLDNDAMTAYQFWDSTSDASSGHWVVGGVAQGTNQAINVTAAQLSTTTFLSGSTSDDLWVRASDGIAWSYWQEFHVNEPADSAPNVFGTDTSMTDNTTTSVLNLFHISDPDNDIPTSIQLWDSNSAASSGHWLVGNVAQPAGQAITVDWATYKGSTSFAAASTPTTDKIWERAFDGTKWSDWSSINVTSHA